MSADPENTRCPDCRWISVSDGQGGGDGEFVPCPAHAVFVSFAELCESGWADQEGGDPW